MTEPTVGRVVWVWLSDDDTSGGSDIALGPVRLSRTQPMIGHVCYVHDPRLINVMLIDHEGQQYAMNDMPLLQDDEQPLKTEKGDDATHAAWMPYQKAVASGQIAPTLHAQPSGDATPSA